MERTGDIQDQAASESPSGDRSLLIVDDDKPFAARLARAMELRGFVVETAGGVAEGLGAIAARPPAFAVIDLRLGDGSGLDVMRALKAARPLARAIILTGYGAIATAVTAVKLGAFDYLAKPVDAVEITAALMGGPSGRPREPNFRCPPTGCAGSTSSVSMNCASATSRRQRVS